MSRYTLTVRGEEMTGRGIMPDDEIVVEATHGYKDGDIVVALIDKEEAVLRRIYRNANKIELPCENPDMPPTQYGMKRVEVQGRMVGIFRQY